MSTDAPEVEVTVTSVPEPEPVADDAPDVVVVDTGDSDAGHDMEVGLTLGALAERVTHLEQAVAEVQVAASIAEDVAEHAEDVAETAVDIAVMEPEPEPEPEPVEDESPASKPWTHRGIGEMFGRGKGDN